MKENDSDILYIHFTCDQEKSLKKEKASEFKKFFKIPLCEYEYNEMNITEKEYDCEFSLSSKEIAENFTQLINFGDDITIHCTQEEVQLITAGISGEMQVDIPIDHLSCYSIVEDEEINLTYSLLYLNKMCITNKISSEIEFSLSNDFPMKICYDLGENSKLLFFIATKIEND
jgi:proliferating cell nuclear antigen PCNA